MFNHKVSYSSNFTHYQAVLIIMLREDYAEIRVYGVSQQVMVHQLRVGSPAALGRVRNRITVK